MYLFAQLYVQREHAKGLIVEWIATCVARIRDELAHRTRIQFARVHVNAFVVPVLRSVHGGHVAMFTPLVLRFTPVKFSEGAHRVAHAHVGGVRDKQRALRIAVDRRGRGCRRRCDLFYRKHFPVEIERFTRCRYKYNIVWRRIYLF